MKVNRRILKIKSGFYYYTLVVFGGISLLFFSRCNTGPSEEEKAARINDSITKVKVQQDSIAKADSVAKVALEQARLDSIAKADSVAKAQKPKNPYKPPKPITKYGIPMNHEPIAEYGPPPNTYKD
ncbi:MAG TPA: hypothetical protein PKN48_14980 [Bacteroidales bacterium]|nr:hypothetical protein [Bacteroidales bacterium]